VLHNTHLFITYSCKYIKPKYAAFGNTLSLKYLSHALAQLGNYQGVTQNTLESIKDTKKPAL
jgi:hypothetical protein